MRFTMLLFTMTLLYGLPATAAQAPAQAGQRVRVTSPEHKLERKVGRIVTATADSIRIAVQYHWEQDTLTLALADVQRLELAHPGGRRTLPGARIGASLGMVIGFVVGVTTYHQCVPEALFDCLAYPTSSTQQGLLVGGLAGGVGAIVGGVIGTAMHAEKWSDVPLRPATIAVRPLPDGRLGMGLALHF